MLRTIIFDFDGVLAESVEVKTKAYALIFQEEGKEVVRQIVDFHLKFPEFHKTIENIHISCHRH